MWKVFVRAKVIININKPLKHMMKIKKEGDTWSWINIKYDVLVHIVSCVASWGTLKGTIISLGKSNQRDRTCFWCLVESSI